jgi:general secretion pathway protein G
MVLKENQQARNRRGFTLLEILVVVAIIVVLASIGGYYYMQTLEDSKVTAAQLKAKGTLTPACEAYKLKVGVYPASLDVLLQKTEEGFGPFLKSEEDILDPWKQPYAYDPSGPRNNGTQPDISTRSPSGIEIGNWPAGH